MGFRRLALGIAAIAWAAAFAPPASSEPSSGPTPSSAILLDLRSFRQTGSVLYIAAHPDDENTRLIAYLARGRGLRTAYLSLTRGDGGQNLIGPELDEELGAIRTQELLAARRIDGGRQFFSRARDFGFSKDYRDTLERWGHQEILSDVVRIIRTFRPDVLITRFSTIPGGTHGHHTASAVLAQEAFALAGDPKAFPEQLETLKPWQPRRILLNVGFFSQRRSGGEPQGPGVFRIDIGGYEPLLGESFGEIAALSRSMHKSQGNGTLGTRGVSYDYFRVTGTSAPGGREPPLADILDGIDTSWARYPGGAEIDRMAAEAVERFDAQRPDASVAALLAIRSRLAALPADPVIADKRRQLDRILQDCLGLYVETVVPHADVTAGETLELRHTVIARADASVRWLGVRYPSLGTGIDGAVALSINRPASRKSAQVLPPGTPLSQPYWLREEGTPGRFRVDDPTLIGRPENPPVFPVEDLFEVGGQTLVVEDEPVQVVDDPVRGEIRRRLEVIPPVSLEFVHGLELFAPGATRTVSVDITASRAGQSGTLRLNAPKGWRVTPESRPFSLSSAGGRARLDFTIAAPPHPASAGIVADAEVGGAHFENRRIDIRYDHIPEILLQPVARLKAVDLDLAIRGHTVGYLPGAGDLVAECLGRMGYSVTLLDLADLTPERLRHFDSVVLGVRALNTREGLVARLPALFAYVEAGGTVIEQYNTSYGLLTDRPAPYGLKLSTDRVTDEHSAVTLLAPGNPALTTPNRIVAADFDGWVQERGRYFPVEWDPRFTPLLSCNDPGEAPLSGGILVAHDGKGYFVYTGLSWFRELPDGVPGAYRLFANLISLGK